jgi:hypothetical protein
LLFLLLGVYDMLDSFNALEWALQELTYACLVSTWGFLLGGGFLAFYFWVSAEMHGCVGVVTEGITLERGGISEYVLFLLDGSC